MDDPCSGFVPQAFKSLARHRHSVQARGTRTRGEFAQAEHSHGSIRLAGVYVARSIEAPSEMSWLLFRLCLTGRER